MEGEKEKFSSDKLKSFQELIFGSRAKDFDAFLPRIPSFKEFLCLVESLNKPETKNVIFDLDGTLVPPYAEIPEEVVAALQEYKDCGMNVFIYTQSGYSDRLKKLAEGGIVVVETEKGKPSLQGFQDVCKKYGIDHQETAMIGNFPVTDMPLVPRGEEPYFPLNILVESIPPQKKLVDSWKRFFRVRRSNKIRS